MSDSKKVTYTIAIATRNRTDALKLSLPRFLQQTLPPQEIVIVDSSDNHNKTKETIRLALRNQSIPVKIIESQRGLTKQRNTALKHVKTEIVFFPDDDSIWYPDTAENQMNVYRNDIACEISAVCAAESHVLPPDIIPSTTTSYEMNAYDKLRLRITRAVNAFEKKTIPNPATTVGQNFIKRSKLPDWCGNEVKMVEWMTGFRMSFRTSAIKKHKFDETLRDYSLFEDIDASFSAWREGLVVAALNSKVFHYKSPEKRDAGRKLGATQLLNKAYVIAKHTELNDAARKQTIRYSLYKKFLYLIAARDQFAKERYLGARCAMKHVREITRSKTHEYTQRYASAITDCL